MAENDDTEFGPLESATGTGKILTNCHSYCVESCIFSVDLGIYLEALHVISTALQADSDITEEDRSFR